MPAKPVSFTRHEFGIHRYYEIGKGDPPLDPHELKRVLERTASALLSFDEFIRSIKLERDHIRVEVRPGTPYHDVDNALRIELLPLRTIGRNKDKPRTVRRRASRPNNVQAQIGA